MPQWDSGTPLILYPFCIFLSPSPGNVPQDISGIHMRHWFSAKVCCPGFDDALSTAVRNALTQGADTGLLDYLVLETSGAADPRRIVGALEEPRVQCWLG